jgi:hypothetical protein
MYRPEEECEFESRESRIWRSRTAVLKEEKHDIYPHTSDAINADVDPRVCLIIHTRNNPTYIRSGKLFH